MSHVSLHSDPMANFGMITQTAAKPEVRRAVLPSLSGQEGRAGVALCCLLGSSLFCSGSIMFGEVAKEISRSI
jgi:hypothetical protein